MSIDAQYETTTPAFSLTTAPTTGNAFPATDPSNLGQRPQAVLLQAETQNIRFTTDGSAPTSSYGMVLVAGETASYFAGPLNALRFIQAASGAKLNVTYLTDVLAAAGPQGAAGAQGTIGPTGSQGAAGTSGGGSIAEWDAGVTYAANAIAIDRAGTWLATGSNTNSRPVSGNTDWRLIGGLPYVDIVLDPVTMTTAPYYDPAHSGPGLVAVPAPSADEFLIPWTWQLTTTLGDAWAADTGARMHWGITDTATTGVSTYDLFDSITPSDWLPDEIEVPYVSIAQAITPNVIDNSYWKTYIAGQPLTLHSRDDITGGGATFGTRSVQTRIYYTIEPIYGSEVVTYYHVTDVDQGTKTFTVNGDAHTLTGSIEVVGSTDGDNDGTYTIVSATFVTDHTDIVVSQSIPTTTDDGWVKQ